MDDGNAKQRELHGKWGDEDSDQTATDKPRIHKTNRSGK